MFGNKMDKIAKLADKNDAVKLLGMLNDKDEKVVLAAIDALGQCSGEEAFNTLTLRKDTLLTLLQNAGFTPLTEPPYDDFSHFVEQAVHRDFIVARNEQP